MIQELARAIHIDASKHFGEYPNRVRVAPAVMDDLVKDAKELASHRASGGEEIEGLKLLGIDVVEDPHVFFAEVDRGS